MSSSFQVEQSVPICLALSAIGGTIEVLATAVLAYQDAKTTMTKEEGTKSSTVSQYVALAINLCLQVLSSLVGNLFATWFGPVSLVGPVFLSSQLLANMVVFGMILGLEMFTKDMKVGTYVVVIAVVLLPIVGPTVQDDQDNVAALFETWYAIVWSVLQVVGMVLSALLLVALNVSTLSEWQAIVLLLLARATAFTVNLTVSKVMIMNISRMALGMAILLKLMSGAIISFALVLQSTTVTQAKFVPLNASALIVVNAITGMVIWQDWRVVGNWVGYICVFVQLVLGNYLLLGEHDVELLSPDNAHYGRAKAIEMTKSLNRGVVVATSDDGVGANHEIVVPSDGIQKIDEVMTGFEALPRHGPHQTRRRMTARQEAWSSIYGIDRHLARGPRRRATIFVLDTPTIEESE